MPDLAEPSYWLARLLFQRGLAFIYLMGFLVTLLQFKALLGEKGLEPVPEFLKRVPFKRSPSLFYLHYSDRFLSFITWLGIALSIVALSGYSEAGPLWLSMLVWFLLWFLYLSIVNVGQTFYSFGWETMLLETGFLAIFLGSASTAPSVALIFLIRWILFRDMFGAGLIKMRGDPCWKKLTCLDYHYETQPIPNPFSWYLHRAPKGFHRFSVLLSHLIQLIVPFGLLAPQPFGAIAGILMIFYQTILIISGNLSWLNWLSIVLALSCFSNSQLEWLPIAVPEASSLVYPDFYAYLTAGLAVFVLLLSIKPVLNMLSPRQMMNTSFDPLHLVNSYGAFGSVTKVRMEVVLEGTMDQTISPKTSWKEYQFKAKPGDLKRRPPFLAPYHLRLDWLMWFAAMGSPISYPWISPLIQKLLENDPATLKLIAHNPFPEKAPCFIRAQLYRYRFTTAKEKRKTGQWWHRELAHEYLPPQSQGNRFFADL